MKKTVFYILLLSIFQFIYAGNVKIYYFYDPISDRYTFTNQCNDFRSCRPLYRTRGEVKHKKGYKLKPGKEKAYDEIVKKAAKKYDVDFSLIKSVIKAESLYDPNAVSTAGAKGLMQLMPATAKQMGVKKIFDPQQNIMGGTKYLKKLLKKFKDSRKAVAAYNAGPAAVVYYDGIPPYKETTNYVKKVSDFYKTYTGKELW